jgi:hypothetical protein
MKTFVWLFVLGAVAVSVTVCGNRSEAPERLQPTATIKDLMDSILDPSADVLWESVATVVTVEGTEERAPKSDEDWAAIRRHAVRLVEASNLLVVGGRHVAKPGEKSVNPGIELEPEEMEALIRKDPVRFARLAQALQDAAVPALEAIDARSTQGLIDAGEKLDVACENCHLMYWYPGGGPPPQPGQGN